MNEHTWVAIIAFLCTVVNLLFNFLSGVKGILRENLSANLLWFSYLASLLMYGSWFYYGNLLHERALSFACMLGIFISSVLLLYTVWQRYLDKRQPPVINE